MRTWFGFRVPVFFVIIRPYKKQDDCIVSSCLFDSCKKRLDLTVEQSGYRFVISFSFQTP